MASRANRREQIRQFFLGNIATSFPTLELHCRFGSAFRGRVSEINRDPDCPISIKNCCERLEDGGEASWYFSELRAQPAQSTTLFESGLLFDLTPEPRYPD
jgi:hypothetical protein